MKKYKIIEQRNVVATWIYNVEANSEEEAMDIVHQGNIDADEYYVGESEFDESYFDIKEEEE